MGKKLPGLGSNQGLQLQRLTCYRYTTGQWLREAGALENMVRPPLFILAHRPATVKGKDGPGQSHLI